MGRHLTLVRPRVVLGGVQNVESPQLRPQREETEHSVSAGGGACAYILRRDIWSFVVSWRLTVIFSR